MSFTMNVKNECVHVERLNSEILSELSAIIYNDATYEKNIKINTENSSLARFIFGEIKKHYKISPKITVRKGYNFNKNYIYIIEINNKVNDILNELGIKNKEIFLDNPPDYIIDDEELKRAYLRGLFLSCGSVNDPKTSRYHLEFGVNSLKYAKFISKILNYFYLNSKIIKKDSKYMVYVKEAEKIGDFLRIIKAMNAVMYYEDIRIYRDHKNMTNRLNNCEQANVDKIIASAQKIVKDIQFLKNNDLFDLLDDKVKEVAMYREKYQEVSLLELSDIITYETGRTITKSGINHRIKKISDFAEKVRSNI